LAARVHVRLSRAARFPYNGGLYATQPKEPPWPIRTPK
jgi:hypothetical protein